LEILDVVVRRGCRLVVGAEVADGSKRGLTLRIRQGELAVLQAPNGWGKTTLLNALAGLVPVETGEIRLNGRRIDQLPPWERARLGLSLLQSEKSRFGSLTVAKTLHLARVPDAPADIRLYLDRKMATLSGGEARRVALACAGGTEYFKVGLFDEPLTALDERALSSLPKRLAALLHFGALLVALPSAAHH
jgi:ABC-type sugar transport system ATPase subunit